MKALITSILLVLSFIATAQVPTQWHSKGVGGALFSPSINPANDNEFYVGCDMSELFHSQDFGLNYNTTSFYKTQGGHNSKVQFTNNALLLYSIDYASGDPGYVAIPVKSADGGNSWQPLAGNPDVYEACYSINVDYNNPNRVLISNYGSLYFSNNGGATFAKVRDAANSGSGLHIAGAFFDGNTIYVGTNDGLLVSTNAGASFTLSASTGITTGQAIFSFSAAKVGNVTRLLCLTASSGDIYVGIPGSDYSGFVKGVYTRDYGTGNWQSKMSGISTNSDYMMFVGMAQNDINTMYLAGSKNGAPAVMKSTNAGTSWTHVMNTTGNANVSTGWCGQGGDRGWGYAECPFGFTVAPNNANKLLISDFGFVHKSSNGGASWQQAYVKTNSENSSGSNTPAKKDYEGNGLENTTCWQVVWGDSLTMMAGFSDIKGIRSTSGGQQWNFNYAGHAANSLYRIAQHPNGTWYAGTSNIHDMYQSTRLTDAFLDANDTEGKVIFSSDKGASWQTMKLFSHPVFWVALDPNNANRMYASVIHSTQGGVYVSQNINLGASATWTKLPNPPRTQGHPASIVVLNDGKVVATYSGRRTTAFTNSSGCFLYNPTTNTWADVSHSGMYYWTKDVVIDPADATQNTWYVAVFSGWGGPPNGLGGLYRTTNRGANWTKLTASQFDRVTSITFNPSNHKEAYLTTEVQGLWHTDDIQASIPQWSLVNSYPFRQPERVFFNPYNDKQIWVTSFGNGLRYGNVPISQFTISASAGANGSINPSGIITVNAGDSLRFDFVPNVAYHIDSVLVDEVPMPIATFYTFQNIQANHSIRVVFAQDALLTYTISASAGANGSINPSGIITVNAGDSLRFDFVPNVAYHIDSVLVDEAQVPIATFYTFQNVQANHSIRVVFAQDALPTYTISASAGANGSISPSGVITVNAGDSARFDFVPNVAYHIDSILVDEAQVPMATFYTFQNIQANHKVRLTFKLNSPNGLIDFTDSIDWGVYPNPIKPNSKIVLNLKQAGRIKLILRDIQGRIVLLIADEALVKGSKIYPLDSNCLGLSKGLYLLNADIDGFNQVMKVEIE